MSRAMSRRLPLLALALLAFAPGGALAAPGVDFSAAPGRVVPSADALADDPVRPMVAVGTAAARGLQPDPHPAKLGAKILFVNFDGVQLNSCNNNSPQQNCSTIFGGTVAPYSGNDVRRASIIQTVRSRVADFGISVTNTRPQSGDYDMEVVGDWEGVNPDFAGIAPAGDCWDDGGGDISFTLEAAGTTDGMAEIILQELAHTWGLDHVDSNKDLLYPTTEGINKTFRDECLQIVSDVDLNPASGFCSHHAQACGTNSMQNSYQEMLMIFGPSSPDTIAPTVEIVSPMNGDILDGDFVLSIAMADDQTPAILGTRILFESDALAEPVESSTAFAGPIDLDFPVTGLPNGDYDVTVTVQDESDNLGSDTITIRITGSDVPGNDDGADGGSGDGGSNADGGSGDSGSPDSGADDGEGDTGGAGNDDTATADTEGAAAADSGNDGCAVPGGPRPSLPSMAMLLVLVGLGARRRSVAVAG